MRLAVIFVQRRVEQTDRDGQAFHGLENTDEILALNRQQFLQGLAAIRFILRDNHLAHRLDTLAAKEHVLCPAKSDALGSEVARPLGVFRRRRDEEVAR